MATDFQAGFIALNRFGLGSRRDGDFAAAASDPRGFLEAELATPGITLLEGPELPQTALALKSLFSDLEQKRLERLAAEAIAPVKLADAAAAMDAPSMQGSEAPPAEKPKPAFKPSPGAAVQVFRAEASARLRRALAARPGFVERLVAFWTNHFCVSTAKGGFVRISAGAFERDAIRPHVLGRFRDMLQAVESHPAMLFYLDNQFSAGPNSAFGQRTGRGLNENLAREILELHTLGVNGGYSQADVTSLARIITGWTFIGRLGQFGEPGRFFYNANTHEPGLQTLLGRPYDQEDVAKGRAALADIAQHPATAEHIAFKFARHFLADDPPVCTRRQTRKHVPHDRRRSESARTRFDRFARGMASRAYEDAQSERVPVCCRTDCRSHARRSRPFSGRAEYSGHAALGSARSERLSRYGCRLGKPRGHGSAP
jgi:uncharacterized protein (DUF1800 family)